jgi:tetratricopeptide (TPR) repeat protein
MKKREPSEDRKVVPLTEAAERRRAKLARERSARGRELVPDGPDAASDFTMLGNIALVEGSFEDAIKSFSRALALAPKDVNARAGRARARAALGEHALALADFDAAARARGAPRYDIGRAASLASLGRMEEAVRAMSRAITAAPDDAGAHYLRAVYESHVDPDDPRVRAGLDRAVELAPHNAIYLRARAEHRTNAEEYDLAVADFDRLVSLAPDDPTTHYLRGECLIQCMEEPVRQREAALVSLERALELAPKNAQLRRDIFYAIARAREGLPDPDAHLAALDRALVEMPTEAPLLSVRADRRRRRGDLAGAASDRARLKALGVDLERS